MAHSHFCSQTCIDDAESKGPMILEVPAGHVTFKNGALILGGVRRICWLMGDELSVRSVQGVMEACGDSLPTCSARVQDPRASRVAGGVQRV